jgi:hypothetical protein
MDNDGGDGLSVYSALLQRGDPIDNMAVLGDHGPHLLERAVQGLLRLKQRRLVLQHDRGQYSDVIAHQANLVKDPAILFSEKLKSDSLGHSQYQASAPK